jgi:predicted nucleic-acid-binding protein
MDAKNDKILGKSKLSQNILGSNKEAGLKICEEIIICSYFVTRRNEKKHKTKCKIKSIASNLMYAPS